MKDTKLFEEFCRICDEDAKEEFYNSDFEYYFCSEDCMQEYEDKDECAFDNCGQKVLENHCLKVAENDYLEFCSDECRSEHKEEQENKEFERVEKLTKTFKEYLAEFCSEHSLHSSSDDDRHFSLNKETEDDFEGYIELRFSDHDFESGAGKAYGFSAPDFELPYDLNDSDEEIDEDMKDFFIDNEAEILEALEKSIKE